MNLEKTIKSFGEAFRRVESAGVYHPFDHADFATGKNNGIRRQTRRVRGILEYLREGSSERLKELTRCRTKYSGLSSTALTWEFRFQSADDVPKYVQNLMNGNLFHNEGVINHFTAYLFGRQGTSALCYLFDAPHWGEINTDYFKALQNRAKEVWDKARTIQQEILESDRIFKVQKSYRFYPPYIPDPTWELPLEETLRLVGEAETSRIRNNPHAINRIRDPPERIAAYLREGIVPNEAHKFRNPQRVIRFHDLIDDTKIRQTFPDYDIDRHPFRLDDPMFLGMDDLQTVHETAYLIKEAERIEEMEVLGKEIISIFHGVGRIMRSIAQRYRTASEEDIKTAPRI